MYNLTCCNYLLEMCFFDYGNTLRFISGCVRLGEGEGVGLIVHQIDETVGHIREEQQSTVQRKSIGAVLKRTQ